MLRFKKLRSWAGIDLYPINRKAMKESEEIFRDIKPITDVSVRDSYTNVDSFGGATVSHNVDILLDTEDKRYKKNLARLNKRIRGLVLEAIKLSTEKVELEEIKTTLDIKRQHINYQHIILVEPDGLTLDLTISANRTHITQWEGAANRNTSLNGSVTIRFKDKEVTFMLKHAEL